MTIHKHDNQSNIDTINQNMGTGDTYTMSGIVVSNLALNNGMITTNGSGAFSSTSMLYTEPAANTIRFTIGTTVFDVGADCVIDQDLSTTASVTHSLFTATSFVQTPTVLLTKSGNDPLIQFTEDSTTVGLLSADKTASQIYFTDSSSTFDILTIDTGTNNVGINTAAPAADALLDLTSDASKKGALLVPRMTTTDKNSLTAVNGMIVYDTTLNKFQGYENGSWTSFI
jgi:hypothetical protein